MIEASEKRMRILRTAMMAGGWICMGMYSEITGPTLPFLKYRVQSNYEEISRALAARSVGFLLGSLTGGVLCDKWPKHIDLWNALFLLLPAIAVTATPWCKVLSILAALLFIDGVGKGALASGGNSLIIQLWQEKAASPTHLLHFSFGIGALSVPQIVRLFLPSGVHGDGDINNITQRFDHTLLYTTTELSPANNTGTMEESTGINPPIEYPYGIVGIITASIAMVQLAIYIFARDTLSIGDDKLGEKDSKPAADTISITNCCSGLISDANKRMEFGLKVLLFLFWSFPVGAERAYGKFIFSYSVEGPPQMSSSQGTIVETVFWATFTAGRGASIFISKLCPQSIMLSIDLGLNILAALMLSFVANSNITLFWIFNGVFGAALSPLFPASIAWANSYVKMTAMMTAVAFIASAVGAIVFSWLSGYLFEYHGPPSLMYLILGYATVSTLSFILLFLTGRYTQQQRESTEHEGILELKDGVCKEQSAYKNETLTTIQNSGMGCLQQQQQQQQPKIAQEDQDIVNTYL